MTKEELYEIAAIIREAKRRINAEAEFIEKNGIQPGGIAVEIPVDKRPPFLITSYPLVIEREELISITVKGKLELPERK